MPVFQYQGTAAGTGRLPLPGPEAEAHSRRLSEVIRRAVDAAGGCLPFDRFMELALYAPGLGYYAAGSLKFGAGGDFVTAPEVSPLFGRCIARQCRQVLEQLGEHSELLEFGAGSGALAVQLLSELQRLDCLPSRYLILELSPELRARQRQAIAQQAPDLLQRVVWLEQLPEAGFSGIVLANELLDAMPVQRFRISRGQIFEQHVSAPEQGFELVWSKPSGEGFSAAVAALLGKLGQRDDFESEINLRAEAWLAALAERLASGLLLVIDYGYARAEYYHPQRDRGTLMCHYRHRAHPDPLFLPGLQDITAHVDFSALADVALQHGLQLSGWSSQASFLFGCGLEGLLAASDPNDIRAHLRLTQEVKMLTLPSEMGERFKVLGLTRDLPLALDGFSMRDMSGRLRKRP